ncbi:MAG: 4-hydroxy-tetrahydrodipicolinate synthase [Oscillospiraceae bacterium]|nr:4-hydroxy-tetrahydrodipicolinate synthase [Oscillospiraceae bacterium]
MKKPLFTGCGTALITPFKNGEPDIDRFRSLVNRQLKAGIDALIVCATTGEAPTLKKNERTELIRSCVSLAKGKAPVIAGTGSNDTGAAVELSREAEALGADGVLVVTPYYNKTTQAGLVAHYTAIAEAVNIPVILYNVPSRTGVSCSAETYAELAKLENIVGVKEASGSFALIQDTLNRCPGDFCIWSGNDEDTAAIMALGGVGVISTAANLIPDDMRELTHLALSGSIRKAGLLQLRMSELIHALFCEVNPIPVKAAMSRLGLCSGELRLPLCEISAKSRDILYAAMDSYGIRLNPQG